MAIRILPFTAEYVAAVQAFNQRLARAGKTVFFPCTPVPAAFPRRDSVPLYQEYFLALEGETVRGGYIDKPQAFALHGQELMISHYQLPISEGVVDPRYGMVAVQLLKDALSRQPLLFGHGMESYDLPITRFLRAMKWRLASCPLFCRVLRPFRFLRQAAYLRRRPLRRVALDVLALSGLGWLGFQAVHAVQRLRRGRASGLASRVVEEFGSWADPVWDRAKAAYALIALRRSELLNVLYPPTNKSFLRLQVLRDGQVIGWAVLFDTPMTGHKHLGTTRVGSVVDCLAVPGAECDVVTAATAYLKGRGVDVILTNQLARAWCEAFARNGYLRGPVNCVFVVSPALAARLEPFDANVGRIHMTCGDGDGPFQATTPRAPPENGAA